MKPPQDDVARRLATKDALEAHLATKYPGRHVGVFGLPTPPNEVWLAGTVSDELVQFFEAVQAPLAEMMGKRDAAPETGENLAMALAHYWDSDGQEMTAETVLDLPNDKDPNLQAGILGAMGVSLKAKAEDITVNGLTTTVVHFEPLAPLPQPTRQAIDRAYRRGIMGPRR